MLETTFATEPIVGYRAFTVNRYGEWGPIGIGAFSNQMFAPGNKYQAVHVDNWIIDLTGHRPFAECRCGFYAWKTMENVMSNTTSDNGLFYVGPVLLSGIVVEHEFGFRATEMTVLQYEQVLQTGRYAVMHEQCPTPTDYYCMHDPIVRGKIRAVYSRKEWETAITNTQWEVKNEPLDNSWRWYNELFYKSKEIDLERIQSEPHSGE